MRSLYKLFDYKTPIFFRQINGKFVRAKGLRSATLGGVDRYNNPWLTIEDF